MAAIHPFPPHRETDLLPDPGAIGHGAPAANDAAVDPLAPTVFHEHWWLDTVTRGGWQAAEVRSDGKLAGWMPYVLSRQRGFRVSVMPPLTHLLGPVVPEGSGSSNTRWLRRLGILQELAAQLPRVAHFSQTFHPDTADVLAFQSRGFETFTQFTAEVAPATEALLWSHLRDKTRNVIRRAQEQCRVEAMGDPHEFLRFYLHNLEAAGERFYFDPSLLVPLVEAARSRHRGRVLVVRAPDGRPLAAVFYVWDRRRLWYFLSTRDPKDGHNGAVSLLVWRGLQMAAKHGLVFDFDGVAGEGACRFYGSFGARFVPRLAVWRRSPGYAFFRSAIELVRGRSGRNPFVAP
ncbi:GNAT family N-acetyltransferase [Ramlibacter sp. PS4R-6]|uniref:GNAT family N-acetyltransferase n=1 Tax=Ramlibacter sp. PS4R-6 TaxID=3133438 RepID=UPI0030A7E674